jgi:uncharacterized protein (TIGR02646 family)
VKFIVANHPPAELIAWIANSRSNGIDVNYDTVGQVKMGGVTKDVKDAIKRQRLEDQGYICAYTMVHIEEGTSHIEHLKPRSLSKAQGKPEETLDYGNLVACFPANGGDTSHGCGAPVRGEKILALTPREQRCERVLRFKSSGRVEAAIPDPALGDMIERVLCLNTAWLLSIRRGAILNAGVALASPKPLGASEAARLAGTISTHKSGGKFTPFCVAIAHAAREHIDRLQKLASKRKYARQYQAKNRD